MVELALRLVFSLAVVVGMVLLLARLGSKRFRGSPDAVVRVLHRQPLSRGSAVAVVTVGSRVLVLGTTEQRVALLTELDPVDLGVGAFQVDRATPGDPGADAAFAPALEAALRREAGHSRGGRGGRHAAPATTPPLAGSVLSPQTWRQALAAVTRKTQSVS